MGGKSKPSTQTTTQNQQTQSTPWAPAEPALMDMISQAQKAYAATPKVPTFTGPNADQIAAVDSFRQVAGVAGQGADELRNLGTAQARGDFLNPESNPYLRAAIDAAINPLRDKLDSNVLSIGDAATLSGAYGGDRQALLKGQALTGFNREALDASSRMLADNYRFERGLQQGSGGLLMDANRIATQPGLLLDQIGQQQQNWEMQKIAAAMDAPWAGLDRLSSVLGTVTPYGTQSTTGTTTTVGTPAKASGAQSALSGALGGASAGAAFGPWGAAIGGIAGGLGGLFG